jgi:hypothetical protein
MPRRRPAPAVALDVTAGAYPDVHAVMRFFATQGILLAIREFFIYNNHFSWPGFKGHLNAFKGNLNLVYL